MSSEVEMPLMLTTESDSEILDDDWDDWDVVSIAPTYEIYFEYPYPIRKRSSQRIIAEGTNKGYISIYLNGKQLMKHRLIALQWLDNPDSLKRVRFKNGDSSDIHLSNLKWF